MPRVPEPLLVTSHVEVWIETPLILLRLSQQNVTSHVEVWIETFCIISNIRVIVSPPTWRCGLKPQIAKILPITYVTSHVEVWIETKESQ